MIYFEDEPFVPPTIVEVPPPPIFSARQLAHEEALIIRRATNPRPRSEIRALAQVVVAPTLPPLTAALFVVEPLLLQKGYEESGQGSLASCYS